MRRSAGTYGPTSSETSHLDSTTPRGCPPLQVLGLDVRGGEASTTGSFTPHPLDPLVSGGFRRVLQEPYQSWEGTSRTTDARVFGGESSVPGPRPVFPCPTRDGVFVYYRTRRTWEDYEFLLAPVLFCGRNEVSGKRRERTVSTALHRSEGKVSRVSATRFLVCR